MLRSAIVGLAVLLTIPATASAHHGWGAYDASRPKTLDGVVQSVRWRNPHVELNMRAGGRAWSVILAPVARASARGLSAEDLEAGERLRVVGYPRKDGTAEVRAERIVLDGRTIEMR